MIKVCVLGALGRVGQEVVRTVLVDKELELVASVDPIGPGPLFGSGKGIAAFRDISYLEDMDIDVAVDFTNAGAAMPNILWALERGIHCVIGTTGLTPDNIASIKSLTEDGKANALIAPNFAIGAVMMMRFSEMAAGVFDQCEIIELHHRGKKDSPSGTAIETARRIEGAIDAAEVPGTAESAIKGARGGICGPVHIHSVRLDGLVADQEVIFGAPGQTLSIKHSTTDRTSFMPGIVIAIKAIGDLPGLTVGLEPLLGL